MFFDFATENTEKKNYFRNCQWNSSLHCFCALILFFVKALRQWWRIREAMTRWNVNYGKKLKQWSDEALNAGEEIEAMKRLTLHRIASSLHCFCCPALDHGDGSVPRQFFSPKSQDDLLILKNRKPLRYKKSFNKFKKICKIYRNVYFFLCCTKMFLYNTGPYWSR